MYASRTQEICGDTVSVDVVNQHHFDYTTMFDDVTMSGTTEEHEVKLFWHEMEVDTAAETYTLHYEQTSIPSDGADMPSSASVRGMRPIDSIFK